MNERKRAHQKIAASLATHTAPSTSLTTHNAQPVLHNNNEKKHIGIFQREKERGRAVPSSTATAKKSERAIARARSQM